MKRVVCMVVFASSLWAQAPRPTFEVISIKVSAAGAPGMRIMTEPGNGRFVANNVSVRQIIALAYQLQDFQLSGAPEWTNIERYEIEAKPAAGFKPTPDQTSLMMQALLEERFHLQARRETKNGPMYALVIGKDGLKMKLSADQSEPDYGPPAPGSPPPTAGSLRRGTMITGFGAWRGVAVRLDSLVRPLTANLRRRVVDRTNLTGFYDLELKWTPDQPPANLAPGVEPPRLDPNGPTIFTAIQEQLGLKLESTTGPIETLVIEKLEKPTQN